MRVQVLPFKTRVSGSGLRAWDLGPLRAEMRRRRRELKSLDTRALNPSRRIVSACDTRISPKCPYLFVIQDLEFRVESLGFRVEGAWLRGQGSGFRMRVEGSGFRVQNGRGVSKAESGTETTLLCIFLRLRPSPLNSLNPRSSTLNPSSLKPPFLNHSILHPFRL